jgi:hypothetical protein
MFTDKRFDVSVATIAACPKGRFEVLRDQTRVPA